MLESRSEQTWGLHHRNPSDLEISADQGCIFCSRLIARLEEAITSPNQSISELWHHRVESGDAAYRWSIRKAASISELSSERIILNFRSLPSKLGKGLGAANEKVYTDDLTFFLFSDDALSFPPLPHELGPSTSSMRSWEQVNGWLNDCERRHDKCQDHLLGNSFRPTRLLDIGHSDSPWPPKAVLMSCADAGGSRTDSIESYVTLSHSWGKTKFAKLLKKNLEKWRLHGIPWAKICTNSNFVQAVDIARHIKARYIWIDSLCIVQDDAGDWNAEAPKMQDIYRNSYCNIAASDSRDASGGMFRGRDGRRVAMPRYTAVPGKSNMLLGSATWRVVPASLWRDDLLSGPLYKRGWVFQERMLAPRILHYARNQIFWDCATVSACEALPAGLPPELDTTARIDRHWRAWLRAPSEQTDMDVDTFWASAVRTYSSNDLTKQSDKLAAIWGIAAPVAEKQRQQWGSWGAGLWATKLEQQLAWKVTSRVKKTSNVGQDPTPTQFPTWSWASVKGTVELAKPRVHGIVYTVSGPDSSQKPIFFHKVPEDSPGGVRVLGINPTGIEMRCHVGIGIAISDADPARMWLKIEGTSEETKSIQIFPDSTLGRGALVEFLILLVSRSTRRERTQDSPLDATNYTTDEFLYSGFGLMIQEKDRKNVYSRVGVVEFSDLSQAHWDKVRRVCGDHGDPKTTKLSPTSSSAKIVMLE